MSENKEYISQIQENGAVHISEDVLTSIAATAALEVEGVSGLGTGRTAELLTKKNSGKGVKITIGEDNTVSIECSIIVNLGQNIVDAAKAVQDAVVSAVESVTGIKVADVNVTVAGIALPKEQKK